MKIRVLGIDPAAAGPTGYGVVEAEGRHCQPVGFGVLGGSRSTRDAFGGRLRQIHALVAQLIEEFSPDVVAVESVFTARNIHTALKLAEVRGVVLLAAAQKKIPVHSYSPGEVKASVVGRGNASKPQMQQMVCSLLSLSRPPQPADVADALAVALCHIQAAQTAERFGAGAASRRAPRQSAAARLSVRR